jgi:hypothetical protein
VFLIPPKNKKISKETLPRNFYTFGSEEYSFIKKVSKKSECLDPKCVYISYKKIKAGKGRCIVVDNTKLGPSTETPEVYYTGVYKRVDRAEVSGYLEVSQTEILVKRLDSILDPYSDLFQKYSKGLDTLSITDTVNHNLNCPESIVKVVGDNMSGKTTTLEKMVQKDSIWFINHSSNLSGLTENKRSEKLSEYLSPINYTQMLKNVKADCTELQKQIEVQKIVMGINSIEYLSGYDTEYLQNLLSLTKLEGQNTLQSQKTTNRSTVPDRTPFKPDKFDGINFTKAPNYEYLSPEVSEFLKEAWETRDLLTEKQYWENYVKNIKRAHICSIDRPKHREKLIGDIHTELNFRKYKDSLDVDTTKLQNNYKRLSAFKAKLVRKEYQKIEHEKFYKEFDRIHKDMYKCVFSKPLSSSKTLSGYEKVVKELCYRIAIQVSRKDSAPTAIVIDECLDITHDVSRIYSVLKYLCKTFDKVIFSTHTHIHTEDMHIIKL